MALNKKIVSRLVKEALFEDRAHQDITTRSFIPRRIRVEARIIVKEEGVVSGLPVAREVFKTYDPSLRFKEFNKDGDNVKKGRGIAVVSGRAQSILSCERVALNFLSYLSGISTQTFEAVRRVRSKNIRILDTRKTTPLLRILEKYAVLKGRGKNHRLNLAEQYLVKDNHLSILKKKNILNVLKNRRKGIPFEIEVESPAELPRALSFCPDIVMLDNFSPRQIRRALAIIHQNFPEKNKRPLVELSGGINLKNISRYALRGVDFISLGALTHSSRALDISLEIIQCL